LRKPEPCHQNACFRFLTESVPSRFGQNPKKLSCRKLVKPPKPPISFQAADSNGKKARARLEQELVVILSGRQGREGSGAEWQKCGSHFCAQTALLVIPSGTESFARRAIL
jgi:hypothetical protein